MNSEKLNNLIRDLTELTVRPKSEVRRRIKEVIQDALKEFAEEVRLKERTDLDNLYGHLDWDDAVTRQSQLITNALNKLKE